MTAHALSIRSALLALCCALTACGGGGVNFGGGISGTGKPTVTVGTITATDTLTVASTSFTTATSSVSIDGVAGTVGDLRVGMTATVQGVELDGAVEAQSIDVEDLVRGSLDAKPTADTLVVLGQTLRVDARTVYGPGIVPASPSDLVVGDELEVYGYVLSPGMAFATRIERVGTLSSLRVVGFASAVNPSAGTLEIGALVVDYAGADTSGLPGGAPQNGQLLKVRGLATLGSSGQLIAIEIGTQDLSGQEDNQRTEVEGYVTEVISATRFLVGGVTVDTTPATVFEGGTASDVAVGAGVEVQGDLTSGVLTATHVELDSEASSASDD